MVRMLKFCPCRMRGRNKWKIFSMKNSKKMIAATVLTLIVGLASGSYAMDAASFAHASEAREEERKDEVAQQRQLTDEQKRRAKQIFFFDVMDGNRIAVETALRNGIEVNEVEEWGSALHVAASYGKIEIARMLLDKGARTDLVSDRDGYTALHKAVGSNHGEVVKLLLERGAPVNAVGIYNGYLSPCI